MPAVLVGFNELTRVQGNEPDAAAIERAFAGVNLGARLGGFVGRPRITRELVTDGDTTSRGLYTRAVGLFALPDTDYARQHQTFTVGQARSQVLAALARETGSSDWTQRPLGSYFPDVNGSVEWWSSGQAAQTATRDRGMLELFATQVSPERIDGPNLQNQGATYGDAAAAAGQAVMERGVLAARDAAAAAGRAAVANWPLVLGIGGVLGLFLWWRYAPRRAPRLEADNPRPKEWALLAPGTPYGDPAKGKGRTKSIGRTTFDGAWIVTQRATPTKKKPREGAYRLVSTRGEPDLIVPASRVARMLRAPAGRLVPPTVGTDSQQMFEEGERDLAAHRFLPYAPGLPYPVREGSSPCLPGAPVWRELEEAAGERAAILFEDLGREPDAYELGAALEGDPAWAAAEKQWRACVKQWAGIETQRAGKGPRDSAAREAARRRADAIAQGVDLGSADYVETLSEGRRRQIAKRQESAYAADVRKMQPRAKRSSGPRSHKSYSNPMKCGGC